MPYPNTYIIVKSPGKCNRNETEETRKKTSLRTSSSTRYRWWKDRRQNHAYCVHGAAASLPVHLLHRQHGSLPSSFLLALLSFLLEHAVLNHLPAFVLQKEIHVHHYCNRTEDYLEQVD